MQYSGYAGDSHVVMCLSIDSAVQKHTVSLNGNTHYVDNFGLWQGSFNSDAHKVTPDYCSLANTANSVSSSLEWAH